MTNRSNKLSGRTASTLSAGASAPHALVTRTGTSSSIAIGQEQIRNLASPERILAVDCSFAKLRNSAPEIWLGQCNPADERKLSKVVIARYESEMFCQRDAQNEPFRLETETTVDRKKHPAGRLAELCQAGITSDTSVVVIDVFTEIALRMGSRGVLIFLSINHVDYHSLYAEKNEQKRVGLRAEMEITTTAVALADLLGSWHQLAQRIRNASK